MGVRWALQDVARRAGQQQRAVRSLLPVGFERRAKSGDVDPQGLVSIALDVTPECVDDVIGRQDRVRRGEEQPKKGSSAIRAEFDRVTVSARFQRTEHRNSIARTYSSRRGESTVAVGLRRPTACVARQGLRTGVGAPSALAAAPPSTSAASQPDSCDAHVHRVLPSTWPATRRSSLSRMEPHWMSRSHHADTSPSHGRATRRGRTMMNRGIRAAVPAIAVAAVIFSGCGSDDGAAAVDEATTAESVPEPTTTAPTTPPHRPRQRQPHSARTMPSTSWPCWGRHTTPTTPTSSCRSPPRTSSSSTNVAPPTGDPGQLLPCAARRQTAGGANR